jgi:hypothetical protein
LRAWQCHQNHSFFVVQMLPFFRLKSSDSDKCSLRLFLGTEFGVTCMSCVLWAKSPPCQYKLPKSYLDPSYPLANHVG